MSSGGNCSIDNKFSSHLVSNSLNVVIPKNNRKQINIIEYRVTEASDPELIVDQISDLSSAKESVCLLSLLFQPGLFS